MTTLCQSQVKGFETVLTQLLRSNEMMTINCDIQDDCQLIFECDDKLFEVILSIEASSDFIECKYLKRLHDSKNDEETNQIFSEFIDLLAELCQS